MELVHDAELHLLDRDEHHLRDPLAGLHFVRLSAPVPAGNEHLALVVRVDQPGQVAEHEAVLVAKT